jgi:hypothetical protein
MVAMETEAVALFLSVGPDQDMSAVSWGPSYSGPNCRANYPDPFTVQVTGFNSLGDRAIVDFQFDPGNCPTEFSFYNELIVAHRDALIVDYGDMANSLAAIDGITGVDFNDVVSWTVLDLDRRDIDSGSEFTAVNAGPNIFSINALVPGPAYTVCGEGIYMGVTVEGVLPDGRAARLQLEIMSRGAFDADDQGNTCYVDP